jgi:very-short-patch-repair endonuclease
MRTGCGGQPYKCRPTLANASGSDGWNRFGPASRSCHGSRREQGSTGNSGPSFIHLVTGRLHASGKHPGHQASSDAEGPPAHLPQPDIQGGATAAEYLGLPVGDQLPLDHTRSELEARFLALVRRHRLPQPEVNVRIDEFVVDFLWHRSHLVAELDGWATHRTRSAFEADRSRDSRLRVLGFEVVRFTWRQVNEERREVVSSLRALLAGQSGPGPRLW